MSKNTVKEVLKNPVLSVGEREGLKSKLQDYEDDRREDSQHYVENKQMGPEEKATVARISRTLKKGEPIPVNKYDRSDLERESKNLEEQLRKEMVPKSFANIRSSHSEFQKVSHSIARDEMSTSHLQKVEAWRRIQRTLHPDDPFASNTERLRPD